MATEVLQDTDLGPVMESTYEMEPVSGPEDSQPTSPTVTLSIQSSMAVLRVADFAEEGVNVQELPPVDRGLKAWTFCTAAFVLEMMIWGFGFRLGSCSYGIFQDYYTSHPPFDSASRIAIAAVGTVSLAIQYGESCLLLLFMRKYPDFLRTSMWCGLAVYFASLFASSFATKVWQLILLQGVGVGIGGGIVYMPVVKLLPEWFSERRGLASGIIFSGTGVGGFVFPLILNALLTRVGLRWTLRIWAISTTLCTAVAMLGMRSRFPVPKFSAGQRRPKLIPSRLDFLHTPLFWSFACTTLVQGLAQFPVALYIATFTRGLSDQLTATVVLSLFNSSSVVGQVIIGHLTDRISYPSIMVFSALGSALGAFFLWGFADAAIYLYFFAVVFGSLSGGFSSTWTIAAVESAGGVPEFASMAFSGVSFAKGLSAVIGPIVSGLLFQAGGSSSMGGRFGKFGYGAVEIFVGSCALATCVGSVVVALARQRTVRS